MSKVSIPDSFPSLPSVVQKIQALFAVENMNTTLLVELLEQEPLLSANILRLVNSPHYGLSRKVTSINQAVMLLGTTIIRGIIMATVLKKSFPIDLSPYNITPDDFDKICILRTKVLALWMKGADIDLPMLSSAAFLLESGKIVTANEIMKNNLLEEFYKLSQEFSVLEAEKKIFETTSYEVVSRLFSQWLFNAEFLELISSVEEPTTLEQKVLKVLIALINTEGIMNDNSINNALLLVEEYELNKDKLMHTIESIKKEQE